MSADLSRPWPHDPLCIPEPVKTVTFPDGETIAVQVVPITGFAWDNWPTDPQPNEEPCPPE